MNKSLIKNPLNSSVTNDIENSKIILIRHAESEFNKILKTMQDKTPNEIERKMLHKNLSSSKEHVDCFITEKGRNQCQEAGRLLEKASIKYAFTSPLRRSLETCRLVLKSKLAEEKNLNADADNYANSPSQKNACYEDIEITSKIKVIVHPYLFEKIEDSCDLIENINKNREDYKEFDWSLFDNNNIINRNESLYYQANFCDRYSPVFATEKDKFYNSEKFHNNYLDEIKNLLLEKDLKKEKEIIDIYLNCLVKGIYRLFDYENDNDKYVESSFKTIERLENIKKYLLEFIERNKLDEENNKEKIILFGHSIIFKHLTSKNLLEEDLSPPLEESKLKNCEFLGIGFSDF